MAVDCKGLAHVTYGGNTKQQEAADEVYEVGWVGTDASRNSHYEIEMEWVGDEAHSV